jgi:mRNA interferase MazF
MQIKKYDILLADFDSKIGSREAGIRPCVVVQSNAFNKTATTIIVVPLTTQMIKIFPSEFIIEASKINGLKMKSRFLGSQIMVIDNQKIIKKLGCLEEKYYNNLQTAIEIVLDLNNIF